MEIPFVQSDDDDNNNNKDDANDVEEVKTNDYDDISNPFIKAKLENEDIEEDNIPTKIKNNKATKNIPKKNKDKVPFKFKSISDYFN